MKSEADARPADFRQGGGLRDFITGLAMALLGLAAMWGGMQFPRPAGMRVLTAYLTFPGAMPLMLGVLVLGGGLVLARDGWRRRGRQGRAAPRVGGWFSAPVRRGAGVLTIIIAYVACLIAGLLPFWVATYLYLGLTMVWLRAGSLWRIIGISLGVALFLHLVFGIALRLPLP